MNRQPCTAHWHQSRAESCREDRQQHAHQFHHTGCTKHQVCNKRHDPEAQNHMHVPEKVHLLAHCVRQACSSRRDGYCCWNVSLKPGREGVLTCVGMADHTKAPRLQFHKVCGHCCAASAAIWLWFKQHRALQGICIGVTSLLHPVACMPRGCICCL